MKLRTFQTGWTTQQLYEGCLLASLAHAIMVAKYPEFSYEHSWDGINYNVQDGAGNRGTITFAQGTCVGAYRAESRINEPLDHERLLNELHPNLQQLAYDETLPYLLENVSGQVKPVIITIFWADESGVIVSPHDYLQMLDRGGNLLERQVMEHSQSVKAWQEYYDMSDEQVELMLSLFRKRISNPNEPIILTLEELALLGDNEESSAESRASFHALNIQISI
jgi:hypothetical protein